MKSEKSPLGPTIETARLILRPPIAEDFDAFAAMHQDPQVMEFLGGVQSKATAWRTFNGFAGAWHLWGFSMFCLIDKTSGEWLGRVGPIHPFAWPEKEVGWGIVKSAMGKGLALEAAIATMDYAFDQLKWEKLVHCIAPLNYPSQALAIKLGSKNLGPTQLPPPYENLPVDAWGQSRDEWQINRNKFNR
ncbi:MAG: acetyltransferase [Hyphomonadaceae bacterium]|nr:MAG: acetyltransferase [Hyphomonadaceae bacterium]KAF0186799.1 MAG: acetyltransferase [Hyphomonadaceae bacterium]